MTSKWLVTLLLAFAVIANADNGVSKGAASSPSPRPRFRRGSKAPTATPKPIKRVPYKPKPTPIPPRLKGIVVHSFEKGSIFDVLGIKIGDKVISVNGQKTQTIEAFQKQFSNLKAPCQVSIVRDGRNFTLKCPTK